MPFLVDEARPFPARRPAGSSTTMGPVVSAAQFKSIKTSSRAEIDEGARLVTGGLDRPEGLDRGYFVRPTVFTDVTPDMTIAREEIFGPVLAVLTYRDEDEALRIANDSPYGLGGYVFGGDRTNARRVVNGLRAGRVSYNGAPPILRPDGRLQAVRHRPINGPVWARGVPRVKSVYGFDDEAQALPPLFG